MESRFAGAWNQDERRRRRLAADDAKATEADVDQSILDEFSSQGVLENGQIASPTTLGMISRVISRQLWKHIVFLLATGAMLVAFLWQSLTGGVGESLVPVQMTCLHQNIAGLLLLLSGQLCFLIGWLRQESVIDFRGRYRWWRWLAAAGIAVAVVLITNTLHMIPDVMAAIMEPLAGEIVAARPALIVVPSVAFCLVVLGRILPDMTRCPASQSLLVAAVLTTVIRQMLIFGAANDSIRPATLDAMLVVAAFLMFASMLLHCRFVAYICNDPPASAVHRARQSPQQANRQPDKPVKKPAEQQPVSDTPGATAYTTAEIADRSPEDGQPQKKKPAARKSRRKSRSSKRKAA